MINVAVITGRLCAEPELKVTRNGIHTVSLTVAVDRRTSGEDRQADFIDVIAWRQTAEFICKYFRKGSMIAIQAHIQTRMFEDKNGNKRKAVELIADNVSFCGRDGTGAPKSGTDDEAEFTDIPDDLPFLS
ncbi:MAG: single-stranded DNA-binding protein [Clostridiaceae bacterium]|nr:single-stranded DNA-binding protein [Clostridiaceae bacterium]